MRISDWSSDVCSSDLGDGAVGEPDGQAIEALLPAGEHHPTVGQDDVAGGAEHPVGQADVGFDLHDRRGGVVGRVPAVDPEPAGAVRSEEHTSELQSLMRISYAVFCLKKKKYRVNNASEEHEIER